MKRYIPVICFLALLATGVHALAVTPAFIEVDFIPDSMHNFTVKITNNADTEVALQVAFGGEMQEYLALSDPQTERIVIAPAAAYDLSVLLKLPKTVERAGKRTASIIITETSGAAGAVAILTGINIPISINVPYPGKYAEVQLNTFDIAEQGNPVFEILVKNLGKEQITNLVAHLTVREGERIIESLRSNAITSKQKTTEKIRLKSKKPYRPGMYAVTAYAEYNRTKTATESTTLRVGRLFVNITDYTRELEQDKIQKFVIKLKSLWNSPVKDVVADISLLSLENEVKDAVKSPPQKLAPWQEGELVSFIDTANLTAGLYKLEVKLWYEGLSRTETLSVVIKEKPPAALEETPSALNLYVVFLILVIIVVLDIVFLAMMRRKRRKELSAFKHTLDQEL